MPQARHAAAALPCARTSLTPRGLAGALAAAVATLLGACGGGGSSAPPAPTTPFDIAAAVNGIATAGETFTMSASLAGQPATLVAQHQALPNAPFMSFGTLNSFRRTATLNTARSTSTSSEDDYVDLAGRTFYGLQDDLGNRAVSSARTAYPASATIGSVGHLFDASHVDAIGSPIGAASSSWSLDAVAGDANSAYLCLNTAFLDLNGRSTGDYESDCYRITPAGQRLGMRVTLTSPAFGTVTFE